MPDIYTQWVDCVRKARDSQTDQEETRLRKEISQLDASVKTCADPEALNREVDDLDSEVQRSQAENDRLRKQVEAEEDSRWSSLMGQISEILGANRRQTLLSKIQQAQVFLADVDFGNSAALLAPLLQNSRVPVQRRQSLVQSFTAASASIQGFAGVLKQVEEHDRQCRELEAAIKTLEARLQSQHSVRDPVFKAWRDLPESASQRLAQELSQKLEDAKAEQTWGIDASGWKKKEPANL